MRALITETSGIAVSARLKALGVDSVILERNKHVGDNWGRRYDCLSLHTPTGYSQMPFMREPRLHLPWILSTPGFCLPRSFLVP